MFKKLLLATATAVATIIPVGAEVQPGTASLLDTLQENGVVVTVNPNACLTNGSNGQYRFLGFKREIVLCPGADVDGDDHNTVRHEVIHAIQHCVNVARGTHTDTPIITDPQSFSSFVNENLSPREQRWVMNAYDESQHLTELEAFAGARAYTSAELEEMFLDVCTVVEPTV